MNLWFFGVALQVYVDILFGFHDDLISVLINVKEQVVFELREGFFDKGVEQLEGEDFFAV